MEKSTYYPKTLYNQRKFTKFHLLSALMILTSVLLIDFFVLFLKLSDTNQFLVRIFLFLISLVWFLGLNQFLNLDNLNKTKYIEGRVIFIKDLRTKYPTFRYIIKIDRSSSKFFIDQNMFSRVSINSPVKIKYLRWSKFVAEYEI